MNKMDKWIKLKFLTSNLLLVTTNINDNGKKITINCI